MNLERKRRAKKQKPALRIPVVRVALRSTTDPEILRTGQVCGWVCVCVSWRADREGEAQRSKV